MEYRKFLQELELLTHDQRVQRLIEVGRTIASDQSAAVTIATLEKGNFYERLLALQACYSSRDANHVLRALLDESGGIRAVAVGLVPLVCDDAQVQTALERVTLQVATHRLLPKLLKQRRHTAIDAFLSSQEAKNSGVFYQLLPFGTNAFVATRLEQLMSGGGQVDWSRLARLHPDLMATALLQQAQAATRFEQRLLWQINSILPTLAKVRPDRAVELVQALTKHFNLTQLSLSQLIIRRPVALVTLILQADDKVQLNFGQVAHRLETSQLVTLLTRYPQSLNARQTWFKKLSPAQRREIYQVCNLGWRDNDGNLGQEVVTYLPADLREYEGRRHLELPALATRPAQRLPYAAFLSWNEARQLLDTYIRNPDADLRSVALAALIFATRYQREKLADLLTLIRARKNEQDPVRLTMLMNLAQLPPGCWKAEHLPDLGQIIREALNASDLSVATASYAERLIVVLLPFYPQWSAEWLGTLVRERGRVSFYNLADRLSDADVRRIAPALLPVLQAWETREREHQLISAANSLGRRLRAFEQLVDVLERVLQTTVTARIAEQALELVATHRHYRLASLVPFLLHHDPSWVTRRVVYSYLHRYRQNLLTPYLGQQTYSGRFSTGKVRLILPFTDGFYRWTPAQQTIFANALVHIAGDEVRDSPAIIRSINQLAALPAVMPTRLIALASDKRQAVRDAAVRALGRLDTGQGVPTLLEAMGDDRARIAIYALRRALLEMPLPRALALLRNVPLEKVTVAKEVIRLLGDLRSPEAYQDLLAIDAKADLHRDVRVALLRALWTHLERPQTWPILERAAVSPDPAIATIVGRIPADRLSLPAQHKLVSLVATILGHPDPKVRLDILQRCQQLPLSDPTQLLLPRLLVALESKLPDEILAAANAVFATYTGREAGLVGQAVGKISFNRRALEITVQILKNSLSSSRRHLLPTALAVLNTLANDPFTLNLQASLALRTLTWLELLPFLTQLTDVNQLHPEVLMLVVRELETANTFRTDTNEIEDFEKLLSTSTDERLRRVGLAALLVWAKTPSGWDALKLERLHSYQADSSIMVASAAQFIFPPL